MHFINPHFINKCFQALLAISILSIATPASASYIASKANGELVYSLFSAPNKILRYNMANEVSLESINLDKTPTAFTIANGIAYVAFHRELRAIDLSSGSDQFIRSTSTDIIDISLIGGTIFASEGNGTITSIRALDFQLIESKTQFYSAKNYAASETQSALYFRSVGVYPSDIHKIAIGSDGAIGLDNNSPYHGSYPDGINLFINTSQNKIYDDAGIIYFADTLTYAGSLGGKVDSMTFIGNNPIVLRGNKLKLFTAESIEQGEVTLATTPTFIASYAQKIFSFSFSSNNASILISDLASFKLPPLGQPVNPVGLNYKPEFYEHDGQGNIYAIDHESLSVFRWSTTQNTYLETWPLANPPRWATYSSSHKRLYLGYADGKITYFSTHDTVATEHHFSTLATGVSGLLATGNYLFAADDSGAWSSHHSFDINGVMVSSAEWKNTGKQYVWNPTTNRIYHMRDDTSPNDIEWTQLNPTTGALEGGGNSPYHGETLLISYPLIVSDDGQFILNGAGQILDAVSLNIVNALSDTINDGIWIDGKLITIGKSPLSIQFWNRNFEKITALNLNNASNARLLNINDKILLIQQLSSGPNFAVFDPQTLPDSDSDGINDFADNCIKLSNADQADVDNDKQGNACDSDNDNDGMPDTFEIANGLNPLSSSDATEDLDRDGFNNAIEYMLNSAINDSKSTPSQISNYVEGFENGWPANFLNVQGASPWTIQTGGNTGTYSLRSAHISEANNISEVSFSANFNAGLLSLNYRPYSDDFYSGAHVLSLVVDGVIVATISSHEKSWTPLSTTLTRGPHTISLRVSLGYSSSPEQETHFAVDDITFQSNPNNNDVDLDGIGSEYDNCPNTANATQSDIDKDGIGDTCDPQDNRPKDKDGDGISDDLDNCPLQANPQQQDMDRDTTGDACDSDIDGDGVKNSVEKTFSFMNEIDPTDAKKDEDGDGVTNGYEIANSTNPAVANAFPNISLFDYLPLGEINSSYTYFTGYENIYFTENMKKSSTPNTYTVTSSYAYPGAASTSASTYQIERRDTGVYLTQNSYDNTYIDFTNNLILPASMKLGGIVTSQGKATPREAGNINVENITTTFEFLKTSRFQWQGINYQSVTIRKTVQSSYIMGDTYENTQEIIFAKGLGRVSGEKITYNKIEIISLDAPIQPVQPETKKKSGGGAIDIWLLAMLTLLSLASNRKKLFGINSVTR